MQSRQNSLFHLNSSLKLKANSIKSSHPYNKPCLKIQINPQLSPKPVSLLASNIPSTTKDLIPKKETINSNSKRSPKLQLNSSRHTNKIVSAIENKLYRPYHSKSKCPTSPNSPLSATIYNINLSPKRIPSKFAKHLNEYEQNEVREYKKIYYTGNIRHKIVPNSDLKNFGFDFENGNYKLVQGDHLAYRYEIKNIIGKGSYGVVTECFDHKRKKPCAIKVLKNKKAYTQQGKIEISILKSILDSDPDDLNNLIKLKFYFIFRNHIFLVFPLLSISLYDYIASGKFEAHLVKQIREFTLQIVLSLVSLKQLSIIHCDIKPENLLFTNSSYSQLKLIDFGSACFAHHKASSYIQSRFYRAPEVVLGCEYTEAVDMWSLGCVVFEMYSGTVLFPCESEEELLQMIVERIGMPPLYVIEKSVSREKFFDRSGNLVCGKLKSGKEVMPGVRKFAEMDPVMGDFISRCLEWDPEKRISPGEAVLHPWLTIRKKGKSLSNFKYSRKRSHFLG
jgi:dual specificity tyrosine-phosphorylation-regulated kinase 2/3/4